MMAKIERLQVRMNTEEKKAIEEEADEVGYASVSDYARDILLRKVVQKSIDPQELDYIIFKLREIRKLL